MKQIILILAAFLLASFVSLGQALPSESILGRMHEHDFERTSEKGKFLDGTFLNKDWQKGKLKIKGSKTASYECTYHIPQDEFIFRDSKKIIKIKSPVTIEYIDYMDTRFVYIPSVGGFNGGYFEELVSGKARLLKRHIAIFVKRKKSAPYQDEVDAHYLAKCRYYVQETGKAPARLNGGRKKMLKQFVLHKDAIKTFMKDERISSRKEADLVLLVKHYNSLQK